MLVRDDWHYKNMKDICNVNQGFQINIEKRDKHKRKDNKIYITIQHLNNVGDDEYISDSDHNNSVVCTPDDVLMTRTGNTGRVVTGVEGVFHNNFFRINFDRSKIDKDYLVYYLNLKSVQNLILEKAGTSTIPDLNHGDFYSIPFNYPKEINEQKKIARSLKNIDNLIESLQLLINKKEKIMIELINKKIQDFNKKCPKYSLSQICNHYGGTSLEEYVVPNGKYKFISIGNYLSNGKYFDNNQRINSIGKASNKILCKDDLVMVLNDKTQNGNIIGSTILIETDNEYIYNQRSERLVCNKDIILPKFLWIYLNCYSKRKEIFNLSQGGTQIYVNFNKVYKTILSIPNKNEQEELIEIVDNMDCEIEFLNEKLSKYKKIKDGMMDDLLTGKVRLRYE